MTYLLSILLSLLLVSCSRQPEPARPQEDSRPYQQEFASGPLKVRLQLDRTKLQLDETIHLTLEAEAPEEYSVQLPDLESGVSQFRWELASSEVPKLTSEGTMVTSRSLTLEPIVIGEKMSIKSLTCRFLTKGTPTKTYEVSSEEVPIQVTMPPEEFWAKLEVDRTASEHPRLMPGTFQRHWMLWGIGITLGFCLILWWCLRRRRQKKTVLPPPIPADVLALEALRALVEQNLVEQGDIIGFYNGIQEILRTYIENRFGLRAPEQTTEEFLFSLRQDITPLAPHRPLLENFLQHCDLVRFATYHPDDKEIQSTFDACKSFILTTRETLHS